MRSGLQEGNTNNITEVSGKSGRCCWGESAIFAQVDADEILQDMENMANTNGACVVLSYTIEMSCVGHMRWVVAICMVFQSCGSIC